MKVLTITYSDHRGAGGTGAASYALHLALKKNGIDSKILCRNRSMDTPDSITISRNRWTEKFVSRLTIPLGFNDLHGVSSFGIKKAKVFQEADLVHLHSLHSGYFNILALPRLTRLKPTVWTLHDVWPITGHCSINLDCERWVTGCGHCPYPNAYQPIRRDATHMEWLIKRGVYKRSHFTIVVASRWFASLLKRSILADRPVEVIPWGMPLDVFKPMDRSACRTVLGLPMDKKVILFTARSIGVKGKGSHLMEKMFDSMPVSMKKDVVLVTMGADPEGHFQSTGCPVVNLKWVSNDRFKAIIYSAADVYVSPTSQETFGLTFAESIACGTPVVSFDLGPISEIVRPDETGFLARAMDVEDMLKQTMRILDDDPLRDRMRKRCREVAEKEYSFDLQVERYLSLYRRMITR